MMQNYLTYFVAMLTVATGTALAEIGTEETSGKESNEIPRMNTPYGRVIHDTASMVFDQKLQFRAAKYGLNVINLAWEDTARFENSSVGPNISDVTIQVQQQDPKTKKFLLTCMPVIRFPNFSDKTADLPLHKFKLIVGNHKQGETLRTITLPQLLDDTELYMTKPDSWKGKPKSLLTRKETHALVSAQACFLPIPKEGIAEFNPVIFNYQSYRENPAVLTILATREGTSMTIIDNQRDGFNEGITWGQRLFFNEAGQRASLTGQRKTDFERNANENQDADSSVEAGAEKGLNLVLLIQVPLKQKNAGGFGGFGGMGGGLGGGYLGAPAGDGDVEEAVIGHGKVEGPFTEFDDLKIRRDPRYPIRVTVQFYQATSNGVVSEQDMASLANQINRVYKDADFVGSLVVDGPRGRSTEHRGQKVEPPTWWADFWQRHEENTGQSRVETLKMLRKSLGQHWHPKSQRKLEKALERAKRPAPLP